MTGRQLKRALWRLKLSHSEAARRIDVHPRTMRKWIAGDALVPRLVELVVTCWHTHSAPTPVRRRRPRRPIRRSS